MEPQRIPDASGGLVSMQLVSKTRLRRGTPPTIPRKANTMPTKSWRKTVAAYLHTRGIEGASAEAIIGTLLVSQGPKTFRRGLAKMFGEVIAASLADIFETHNPRHGTEVCTESGVIVVRF